MADPPDSLWTIEQVIGNQVRILREDLGWTQVELGEKVAAYLGKPWARQTVSAVEKGDRAFTAAEVVALAHILDATVAGMYYLQPGIESVLVGEKTVARKDLIPNQQGIDRDALLIQLMDRVRTIYMYVNKSNKEIAEQVTQLQRMDELITGTLRVSMETTASDA